MKEVILFIFSTFFILSLNARPVDALSLVADAGAGSRVDVSRRIPVSQNNQQVKFRTIEKEFQSNRKERGILVIYDAAEWARAWNEIHANQTPQPALPPIDFSRSMVIIAFQGEKPTGGYEISIERITRVGNNLRVTLRDTRPGRNCEVTQALTSPYHIIETAKFNGKIISQKYNTVNQCLK